MDIEFWLPEVCARRSKKSCMAPPARSFEISHTVMNMHVECKNLFKRLAVAGPGKTIDRSHIPRDNFYTSTCHSPAACLLGSGLFLRIQIFYVYFRVFLRIFLFSDLLYVFSKTRMFLVALTYSRFFQHYVSQVLLAPRSCITHLLEALGLHA